MFSGGAIQILFHRCDIDEVIIIKASSFLFFNLEIVQILSSDEEGDDSKSTKISSGARMPLAARVPHRAKKFKVVILEWLLTNIITIGHWHSIL